MDFIILFFLIIIIYFFNIFIRNSIFFKEDITSSNYRNANNNTEWQPIRFCSLFSAANLIY